MGDKVDLEQYCQLQLKCPGCGGRGMVPWNRLDRVLTCRSCSSWFRMDHAGKLWEIAGEDRPEASIEVGVRSSMSGYQSHQVPLGSKSRKSIWQIRHWHQAILGVFVESNWGLRAAIISGMMTVVVIGYAVFSRNQEMLAQAEQPLPSTLEERAPLLTEAWLSGNTGKMLRLTDSTRDRDLRRWLSRTPPPMTEEEADNRTAAIEIVSIQKHDSSTADVTVRIESLATSKEIIQQQRWVERQGAWYFVPDVLNASKKAPRRYR